MTGLRSAVAALVAAALVPACGDDQPSERERLEGEDIERSQPAQLDVELIPAEALAGLAATLEAAEPGAFALCPEYAEPAGRVLSRLAGALDDASGIERASGASAALEGLVSEARAAGEELAELSPTLPRAARRHAELTAATRDLADGFSALGEALADGDREAARAASVRTENGLANVGAAADAVLAACR